MPNLTRHAVSLLRIVLSLLTASRTRHNCGDYMTLMSYPPACALCGTIGRRLSGCSRC